MTTSPRTDISKLKSMEKLIFQQIESNIISKNDEIVANDDNKLQTGNQQA